MTQKRPTRDSQAKREERGARQAPVQEILKRAEKSVKAAAAEIAESKRIGERLRKRGQ